MEVAASIIIQKFVRMINKRLWWISTRQRRTDAAKMIQKNFRLFRRWNVIPKLMRARKHNSAAILQKYMRGYLISRHMYHQIQQNKIDSNYGYFHSLKSRLEHTAAKTITLFYFRFKIRQAEKELFDLQQKEKQLMKEKKNRNMKFRKNQAKQKEEPSIQFAQSAAEIKKRKLDLRMRYAAAAFKDDGDRSLFENYIPGKSNTMNRDLKIRLQKASMQNLEVPYILNKSSGRTSMRGSSKVEDESVDQKGSQNLSSLPSSKPKHLAKLSS